MTGSETLILGAVAYDSKVVAIWEGFKDFFIRQGLAFDYILYSNYERQVEALLQHHFHVAWNSPLAWIRSDRLARAKNTQAEAIAMRDTDQDLTSVVIVKSDSKIRSVEDLKGKVIAVGSTDSPQATLIPLLHLKTQGVIPDVDFQIKHHDLLGGKHGDHIGGERDAVKSLLTGNTDAACLIDANHLLFAKEGVIPQGSTRVLTQTATYDHCNFTALVTAPKELIARFRELLLQMSYDDPQVRPLMDLEGLKSWRPARLEGYKALENAVDEFKFYDPDGTIISTNYRY